MGKKKNKNNNGGGGGGGEKKKEEAIISVVLGLDMHCEGCVTKIIKSVQSFTGVDVVKCGDGGLTRLTVIGKVDPSKLREAVEKKVKKKVELVSPAPPKKENNNNNGNQENNSNNGNTNKENKNPNNNNNNKENKNPNNNNNKGQNNCCCGAGCGGHNQNKKGDKKGEEGKKAKEPPITTAVMKVHLHCQGCIQKIKKTIAKTKGYLDMTIDEEKDLITVKGAIDMKVLAQKLSTKLKKKVEIVPPKKEGEKKGGEKEKEGDNGGGGGKGKGGADNNGRGENLIHYVQYGYPNPAFYGYGYGYPMGQQHTPSMFSDENPNACSIM